MENDLKKEARRQYLHFFRIWFVILGVLFVVTVLVVIAKNVMRAPKERGNSQAPTERVYDYADMLTDEEEEQLRELIARQEALIGCDLVLMTINQPVEGNDAKEQYGYRFTDWERNMQDIADDFYDINLFGFDAPHGDGALILDNSYTGQGGTHLSTSGRVFAKFGTDEIDRALDQVDAYIESNPFRAYSACINYIADKMGGTTDSESGASVMLIAVIVPLIVAGIFVGTHLRSKEGKKTTTVTTYVAGGKPVMNRQQDDYIRKHVTQRRIQTSSSSGGGSSSRGHGGAHRSSGGHSHGGGSHRR
ncbi:MAG: TPM domain-containing protein [bacterium]|nr:TPM domain-containing protein [bacterium]MCM1375971.1 TPM domain-containing protein [Muribaculum sp.]